MHIETKKKSTFYRKVVPKGDLELQYRWQEGFE